ncbi:MAG: molybdenum cofactor biosynthesis protein MoaE [Actinobacteria bacterium]|nr:molybdenum cofactor biosynthesis protein MoaE [Actinomycetota bacterium]
MSFSAPDRGDDWVQLGNGPLPVEQARVWASQPNCGAVVVFTGIVRDSSDGREGVKALSYEAWEDTARQRLLEVVASARQQWPGLARVAAIHRLGEVPLGEPTVVIVCSTPHRHDAFDAARYCIDTLKETVPVWKREHWEGGEGWASADHQLRGVGS